MKILFVSGSIGLGHVVRDLAIARELRKVIPGVEISWLAAHPATVPLREAGEEVLPESEELCNYTTVAERIAGQDFQFLGHIVRFDPAEFADRSVVRAELGYGPEPLIVCSIGGTGVGGSLLRLCCDAWPLLRKAIPAARMLLVPGPRFDAGLLRVPQGVQLAGYVPHLYKHLAACDLAIVQAGGSTTLELTALRRPFLYFPLEGHCEQQVSVSGRLARHGAGIRMSYNRTTPASLAQAAIAALGRPVDYPPIRTDGARKAADLIAGLLAKRTCHEVGR